MKLGLYGFGLGALADPRLLGVAQRAEALGFESLWTGEHMVLPKPQRPPSHRSPDHPFLDPLIALSFIAAGTTKIRLCPGVLLLPQRHPVQLAKELASLDVLSEGRLVAAFGVGYLKDEMKVLGVDPATRGEKAEESFLAIKALWNEESPSFHGRWVSFDGVDAYPRPRNGGPPVLFGGNSPAGIRRAVNYADGWYGYRLDVEQVTSAVDLVRSELGRDPRSSGFEITVTPPGSVGPRDVVAYAAAGVDRLVIISEGQNVEEVTAVMDAHSPERLLRDIDD